MINKQEIIDEIKKRAELNDGKPLGLEKFAEETGIKTQSITTMIRKLGKFPSTGDIGVEAHSNKDFPSRKYIRAT